jgi:cardiolipin synthase (CMP-forming)
VTAPEDRILTIPNALSVLRLALIPVFLWLVLAEQADLAGVAVLTVSGITDWADGVIARRTGQTTRLGRLLDPLVDRLTIAATLIGLALRDLVPWWLVGLLAARELLLLALVPALRRRGLVALPVHYLGKAATFALYWGFPFVLVGAGTADWEQVLGALGWAFVIWGTALYWYAALLYLDQARRVLRAVPAAPRRA